MGSIQEKEKKNLVPHPQIAKTSDRRRTSNKNRLKQNLELQVKMYL